MPSMSAFLKCSEGQGGTSNDAREERWGISQTPMCAKEQLQHRDQ